MTISNTERSITVQGDGLTSTFNYDFYMGGSSAYAVLVYTDANGDQEEIDAADFTIAGVTDEDGGTFTYPTAGSPIATGTSLTLSRVLPLTQDVAIGNQGNFYPSAVERGLDYLMMVCQQIGAAGGSLSAESLFGNPLGSSAVGQAIPIGSGLSFSGNTLVVSGVSGSGTVTEVNTGTGLSGGPITGIGTISMATITSGYMLGNFSGATAAPYGVQLSAGSGVTLSSTTATVTISAISSGVQLITSSTPTATGSVTFNSITSSYSHLWVLVSGRSTGGASTNVSVNMTLNGDTGTNYDDDFIQVQNTTVGASAASGLANIGLGVIPWSTSTASMAGFGEAVIFNYADTSLFKRARVARNTIGAGSVGTTWITSIGGSQWRSTAAVTSVTVALSAGDFAAGSKISIYGMP